MGKSPTEFYEGGLQVRVYPILNSLYIERIIHRCNIVLTKAAVFSLVINTFLLWSGTWNAVVA